MLSLYFLISASLLFSSVIKEYISNYDVYETVSSIYSQKYSKILLLNFTVAFLLLISKKSFDFFFGNLISSQWQEITNNMNFIFFDTLFIVPAFLYNYFNGSMNGFLVLIPIFFRFLFFLIKTINNGLYISQDSFQLKFHIKIFVVQFALLFLSFHCFCYFIKYFTISRNPLACLISEQCIFCFLSTLADTIKHVIFIYDINNPGLLKVETIMKYNFLCNLISEFLIIMVEVIIEIYSSTFGLSFYILRPKTIDMLTFSTHLHKYQNWVSLSKMLNNEIPDATEEDLLHEDQCIICRLKMKIKMVNGVKKYDAKRLPCGHCYHLSCLQQWIRQQMKCPLCQYDLKQLIMPNNEDTDGEEENDNFNNFFAFFENLNGHDDVVRNVNHDFQNENENREENVRPRWKLADLLAWVIPEHVDNNQNIPEQVIHHHRRHHHNRSHSTDESNNIRLHKHKHVHHKRKKTEKMINQSNEGNIKISSVESFSSLINLTGSDFHVLTDFDVDGKNLEEKTD